jgi:hypothetical protein
MSNNYLLKLQITWSCLVMNVVVSFYKLIDNNNELFNLSSYINMYIKHLFINNDNNNSIDINMVVRGGAVVYQVRRIISRRRY